jgi:CDP-paratose synthetase
VSRDAVLLTGATGFLGSRIAARLLTAGHEVVATRRPDSNLSRLAAIRGELALVDVDGRDPMVVFKQHPGIRAVVHVATCYGKRGESADEIRAANLDWPSALLQAAMASGVSAFINSDTFFPASYNTYAARKKEFLASATKQVSTTAITLANIRLQHVYGPWDAEDKFASFVIRSCARNVAELRLTEGTQERDFIHADDVADAYAVVIAALPPLQNGTLVEFDVGTGDTTTVRKFVETAHRLTRSSTHLAFGAIPFAANEIASSCAATHAIRSLGWQPRYDLESGIRATLAAEGL